MTVLDRIEHLLSTRVDMLVFLRLDFRGFGSDSQVGRALNDLVGRGVIVRYGVGVYARAKPSVLSGRPIPVRPLEVLAPQALARLGVEVSPSRLVREYNAGRTTQVPSVLYLGIGSRRITRKLGFNGVFVRYERG
ncbi:S-adenosylhomocysteine hydrolase [Variovorax sp. dw_308]|uniref:S-adenosylhomocysteine hydrolase n=1 Tax=Variovorax sp. dw_308 TaxID=2721546 RepID=UPI001C4487CE|nr:S-adenosylhomocysteine hydrolase [Variovorax sp. dw_308]